MEHANTPAVGLARSNTDQFQMSLVVLKTDQNALLASFIFVKIEINAASG